MIIWEIVLLISSILIFRSVWIFLDQLSWASAAAGLVFLAAIGLVSTFVALSQIHKEKK